MSESLNGRYEIVRRLGMGGMGEVLLAEFRGDDDISPGLLVVKRILPTDGEPVAAAQVEMLQEEGRLGLRLVHRNLVETFRLDDSGAQPLVVMEFLAGRSMGQVLAQAKKRHEVIPVDVALAVLRGVCCGLHFAHTLTGPDGAGLGLVHRDISPANILVTFDGAVKVIDFGIAKSTDSEINTAFGIVKGKPRYMAPEQSLGLRPTPQADVWSLGVLFWETLVADRLQFPPDPNVLPSPCVYRPDVSPAVEAICLRMLERDPGRRYPSCAAIVQAIDALAFSGAIARVDVGAFLAARFPDEAEAGATEAARCARFFAVPAAGESFAEAAAGPIRAPRSLQGLSGRDTALSPELRQALLEPTTADDDAAAPAVEATQLSGPSPRPPTHVGVVGTNEHLIATGALRCADSAEASQATEPRAHVDAQAVDPLVGATIAGRYFVERRIGQGGMGAVYVARQERLGRPVAIKVLLAGLSADLQAAERFQVEATAVARLNHPGIVTVYDYGKTDDGTLFLVMELVDGISLRKHLDQRKQLSWPEALSIARQTASALAAAHDKGIVHRDLKPDNLMLVPGGDGGVVVKVLDFGLAKLVEGNGQQLTQRSVIMGTPGYMSPEQINGQPVDSRCDLYALGVMFWEMVVGRPPISDDAPLKVLMRHLHEEIPAPSFASPTAGLPPSADQVILRLLRKDREDRPPSTQALVAVLTRLEAEPWAAASVVRFDVDEWDVTFSALAQGRSESGTGPLKPLPAPSSTLVLEQLAPPDTGPLVLATLAPSPPPAPPSPPPAPPSPWLPPSLPSAPTSSPFALPPPRAPSFGPPVPLAAPLEPLAASQAPRERSRPRAVAPPQPTPPPLSSRMRTGLALLGLAVVAMVVDVVMHREGVLSVAKPDINTQDPHGNDVAAAVAARERQGSRLAIDAALERVRLALVAGPSKALSSTLAELVAERGQLQGDLGNADASEAKALLTGPLEPRARAALLAALGDVDAALGFEADPSDSRTRALLAEIVANRDPERALRLLDKPPAELGTRPLRARAAALLARADTDAAILLLDERLAAVPDDSTARALRALARQKNGDLNAARADVDQALNRGPLAREAALLRVRLLAADATTKPKDLDVALSHLTPFAQRHPAAVTAARLDALRLSHRDKALGALLGEAGPVDADVDVDVDVAIARAAALLALGRKPEAHATLEAIDATLVGLPTASRLLALRLASSKTRSAADAARWANLRRASPAAALAHAVHAGQDPSSALPLLLARPLQNLDADEALVLSNLGPVDPFAALVLARIRSAKINGVTAWVLKNAADPRGLLLLAHQSLEVGDLTKARKLLLRVEARNDLSADVVSALQILFARLQARGAPTEARTRLQGRADAASLLAGAEVDARNADIAGARSKLERLHWLDGLDRGIADALRSLP